MVEPQGLSTFAQHVVTRRAITKATESALRAHGAAGICEALLPAAGGCAGRVPLGIPDRSGDTFAAVGAECWEGTPEPAFGAQGIGEICAALPFTIGDCAGLVPLWVPCRSCVILVALGSFIQQGTKTGPPNWLQVAPVQLWPPSTIYYGEFAKWGP